MSKLHLFQRNLKASNLIQKKEKSSIKGGVRFVSESQEQIEQLIKKLEMCGMEYTMESTPKGWCIDW